MLVVLCRAAFFDPAKIVELRVADGAEDLHRADIVGGVVCDERAIQVAEPSLLWQTIHSLLPKYQSKGEFPMKRMNSVLPSAVE